VPVCKEWVCKVCTLINDASAHECGACGTVPLNHNTVIQIEDDDAAERLAHRQHTREGDHEQHAQPNEGDALLLDRTDSVVLMSVRHVSEHLRDGEPDAGRGGVEWVCGMCTLVNTARARECSVCGHTPPNQAPAAEETTSELLTWLREHGLQTYHEQMCSQGFDELCDIKNMGDDELENMLDLLGVLPGKKIKFKMALGIKSKAPRERSGCSVCFSDDPSDLEVVLVPCGHCFCSEHGAGAIERNGCPVCRAPPTAMQRVYF